MAGLFPFLKQNSHKKWWFLPNLGTFEGRVELGVPQRSGHRPPVSWSLLHLPLCGVSPLLVGGFKSRLCLLQLHDLDQEAYALWAPVSTFTTWLQRVLPPSVIPGGLTGA